MKEILQLVVGVKAGSKFKDGCAVTWLFKSGLEYTGLDWIGDVDSCNVTCSDIGNCCGSWIKKRNLLYFYKKLELNVL